MQAKKFVDLSGEEQINQVKARFQHKPGQGWFTPEGLYAGKEPSQVIAALIDLEAAEIEAVGDCMGGCCMVPPKFEDFVRKP